MNKQRAPAQASNKRDSYDGGLFRGAIIGFMIQTPVVIALIYGVVKIF